MLILMTSAKLVEGILVSLIFAGKTTSCDPLALASDARVGSTIQSDTRIEFF